MELLNSLLLAWLGWKMVSNAHLLWVDALRAKYLMNGASFLSAPINPLSSWLWKGLLKNRGIVQQGACISISNGLNVSIWDMPDFIPRPNPNLIDHPCFCMADLILPNVRAWNRLLLDDLFDSCSIQCILNIHLPQTFDFDRWIWAPSISGFFSVKFAHEVSLSLHGRVSPLSSEAWHKLWGLKIQAKLKHLLWKVAWNILPSRGNIGRVVSSIDTNAWICPFYKGPLETLCHIFLDCDLARIIWRSSSWPLITIGFSDKPISDWILAILYLVERLAITKSEAKKF